MHRYSLSCRPLFFLSPPLLHLPSVPLPFFSVTHACLTSYPLSISKPRSGPFILPEIFLIPTVYGLVWNEAQTLALHSPMRDHAAWFGLENIQGSLKYRKFRIGILWSALTEDYGGFLDVELGTKVWVRVKIFNAYNEMSSLRIRLGFWNGAQLLK